MKKCVLCLFILCVCFSAGCAGEEVKDDVVPVVATVEKNPLVPEVEVTASAKIDDFISMHQHPELPTGCEITSLAMLLSYYGIYAEKCDLADNYLDKGRLEDGVGFWDAFIGNPRDYGAFGCYAPVIERAANTYLEKLGSPLRAYDITGTGFEGLFPFICGGVPVMVWGTIDCSPVVANPGWEINGKQVTFPTPEHCMVFVGYDENVVWMADPYYGDIRKYDRETFKDRYNTLFQQAVVLR